MDCLSCAASNDPESRFCEACGSALERQCVHCDGKSRASARFCRHCGETTDIFKRAGAEKAAAELGCPFLGRIPLDPAIVEGGDAGIPITVADPEGSHAAAFRSVAERVVEVVAGGRRPQVEIL